MSDVLNNIIQHQGIGASMDKGCTGSGGGGVIGGVVVVVLLVVMVVVTGMITL